MVVLLFEQPDFDFIWLHYASLDGQKSAIGQFPQSGFLARQISRPNCTIRWQKSEERSGGISGRKSRSTFAGSLDRKSTRLNSSHRLESRMPSSA